MSWNAFLAGLCVCTAFACHRPEAGARGAVNGAQGEDPSFRAPALRDDFEGGALETFWRPGDHGSGRYALGAVELDCTRARSGSCAVRITVREGDVEQRGDSGQLNERAELDSGKHPLVGRECWYGFSLYLPSDFPIVDVRLVLAQWKQSALAGSPLVAQRFRDGEHVLTVRDPDGRSRNAMRSFPLPELTLDRWHDFVYRIRFRRDESGLVEMWMNGERVVSYSGKVAFPGAEDSVYQKMGLYRDRWPEPMTVYFDAFRTGPCQADVDPARVLR